MTDLNKERELTVNKLTVNAHVDNTKKTYACTIYDLQQLRQDDLLTTLKDIKMSGLVHSDHCLKIY